MFIQTEKTPNPSTLKFIPGRVVMKTETAHFENIESAVNSPFARRLFKIDGVKGVFFGSDFITVTKIDTFNWDALKPAVLGSIMEHYASNEKIITASAKNVKVPNKAKVQDSKIVKQIKELIETRVRPAVAMDGGDIVFENFDNGVVYLHMQGSCAGYPSSTATLKSGIENMLKHYIPEVTEVKASGE